MTCWFISRGRTRKFCGLIFGRWLLCVSAALAQLPTATALGTVRESSGAKEGNIGLGSRGVPIIAAVVFKPQGNSLKSVRTLERADRPFGPIAV